MLTGGHEKKIRVYDLGRPEAEPLVIEGSQAPLRSCLWHPADANLIVSCGSDEKAVRVWDVRTASECQYRACPDALPPPGLPKGSRSRRGRGEELEEGGGDRRFEGRLNACQPMEHA